MKSKTIITKKVIILIFSIIMTGTAAFGAAFTAVASGNWSASATWGGTIPPTNIMLDQVVIPSGINVSISSNLTVNGVLASLSVGGTLTSAANDTLTIGPGSVTGAGGISFGSISFQPTAALAFTGSIAASTIVSSALSLQMAANMMANQTLAVAAGTLSVATGGHLDVGAAGTIGISGGVLSISGGTLGLAGSYNVIYSMGSATAGVELSGAGLSSVTVNVGSSNTVTLSSNLAVSGTLNLMSGTLALASYGLTVTGDVITSGYGFISSTALSSITINNSGGISGTLDFSGVGNAVNNFTVNVGSGSLVAITGTLDVMGTLQLTGGTLNFNGADLTISGMVSGSGMLGGSAFSNLTVNTIGGLTGALTFSGSGQALNNLTLNVGAGNSVALGSNLTVSGALDLTGGSEINISGHSLTINGNFTGAGTIGANASSSLIIGGTGNFSSSVTILGGTIGTLEVNVGGGDSVILGGNVTVAGMLDLQSGSLVLNGHNLTVTGNITAGGSGMISSTAASSISLNTGISTTGALNFEASGNTVGNFTVNVGAGGSAAIGTDLAVNGNLNFMSGSLNIGTYALDISSGGTITGAGQTSYIIIGAGGYLGMMVMAGGSMVSFPVGTAVHFAPVGVQLAAGSTSTIFDVGVAGSVLAQGTTGIDISATQPVVDFTWFVEPDILTNINATLQTTWSTAMEVNAFDHTQAYISHNLGGSWDAGAIGGAASLGGGFYSMTRTGITSFSPFAVFDHNTATSIPAIAAGDGTFEIFPNPASDNLMIKNHTGSMGLIYVDIINVNGQIVAQHELTDTNKDIPVKGLSDGNYFVRLYNDKMNEVKRFTKM